MQWEMGLCVGLHRAGWDFGVGRDDAGDAVLAFPALEAAEVGGCDSLGTLFS